MNAALLQQLLFFLVGGFLVFLAITITRDNFVNRLNRVTGAMLFFAGLGPIFLGLGLILDPLGTGDADLRRSMFYQLHTAWELFFPTLLLFSWIFPVDRLSDFRYRRYTALLFLPQVVHLIVVIFFNDVRPLLQMVELDPNSEGFATILLRPFLYLISGILLLIGVVRSNEQAVFGFIDLAYVGAAFYYLETSKKFVTEPRFKNQARIVLWALRLGLALYVLAVLPALLSLRGISPELTTSMLVAGLVLGAGVFAFAIVRYQFLDIQLIFRQSFIYTLTLALLVGGYIVFAMRAEEMLVPVFGSRAEILSYVLVIFALLLFQPIYSWLDNLIRSMFLRTRTDYRNIIERFSRQVISIFEPLQLRKTIEETLKTALLVENIYFVVFDDAVGEYVFLSNADTEKRTVISREDMMLRGINLLDAPTHYTLLSQYEKGSVLAKQLNDLKVKLIVPMNDAKHLLGFLALSNKAAGYRYSAEDFNLLGVLSNQMVTALTNARLYVESLERLRLQEEINMARQIQLDLLPSKPPEISCSVVAANSIPSRTVGGDFYDFVPINGGERIGIVIADASGKGMPAALMMAQIQAMIRSEVNNGTPIPEMMRNMNQQIVQSTSAEKYVTLFYGELQADSGLFSYANAGHNYPVLVRCDGAVELLQLGGPIIGALPHMVYQSSSVQLNHGDVLFLFTDGLSEAMDLEGREFTEERIRQLVVEHRLHEPSTIMNKILDEVRQYDPTWPPADDTTVIVIKMQMNGEHGHIRPTPAV